LLYCKPEDNLIQSQLKVIIICRMDLFSGMKVMTG
jgi:hypothetical protein